MEQIVNFTKTLWALNEHRFHQICALPFVCEQKDGKLEEERYRHYIIQDTLFLEGLTSALAMAASKATDDQTNGHQRAMVLLSQGIAILDTELGLHDAILRRLGLVSRTDVKTKYEASPTCHHYVSFLHATALREPLPVIVASILPCYWLYREVAKWMLTERQKGCANSNNQTNNKYSEWIDMYCCADYCTAVDQMLSLTDELAQEADQKTRGKMESVFERGFQLEWMFWKSAYAMEQWPI